MDYPLGFLPYRFSIQVNDHFGHVRDYWHDLGNNNRMLAHLAAAKLNRDERWNTSFYFSVRENI
jgi:uncharacterized membrane protein